MMNIENPVYMKNHEFLEKVHGLKRAENPDGTRVYQEKEIAKFMGFENTMELRKAVSRANVENRAILVQLAKEMKEAGKSVREIAIELGRNESSVNLLLDDEVHEHIMKKFHTYRRSDMTPEEKEMWDSGDVHQKLQVRKAMRADGRCEIREVPVTRA